MTIEQRRFGNYPGALAVLLLALSSLLAGCATPKTDERISIAPELVATVEIEQVITGHTVGGLMLVDVRLRNHLDRPLPLSFQFEWLDEKGRAIPSLLSSKGRVTADRRRTLSIRGVAPDPKVADFILYLDERDN